MMYPRPIALFPPFRTSDHGSPGGRSAAIDRTVNDGAGLALDGTASP